MLKDSSWDKFLITGAMIVFVYGIWSTRYVVNKMDIEGSHISKQNAADIQSLKSGQEIMIESLEILKANNGLIRSNHELLIKLIMDSNSLGDKNVLDKH